MERGTVYTETVVYSPPAKYASDAPYQLAIVEFADGKRTTVRILGDRVEISDTVVHAEDRDGVCFFRKSE